MGNQHSSVLATSQKTLQSFERSSDNKGQKITEKTILKSQDLTCVESQDALVLNETKTGSETDDESYEANDEEGDEGEC